MKISKNILLLTLLNLIVPVSYAATIYVNVAAAGGGNGTRWEQAFNNLQSALDVAGANDQIWIAKGTYIPSMPNGGDPRLKTFNLPNKVFLYGGFKGNEGSLIQRNPQVFKTILSGDLNGDDLLFSDPNYATSIDDNAYHVVTAPGVIATLDGLTMQAGNASVTGDNGGALLIQASSNITVNDNIFQNNQSDIHGGAIYAIGPNTDLAVTNCVFLNNKTASHVINGDNGGGAIGTDSLSSLKIDSSKFDNNFAGEDGGALHITGTPGTLTNSSFKNNISDHAGGAITLGFAFDPDLHTFTMSNLILSDNTCHSAGGAIYMHGEFGNPGSAVSIDKSIFTNNQATYLNDGIFRFIGDAGAIFNTDLNLSIINSAFINNSAVNTGGAITMWNAFSELVGLPTRSSLTIKNSIFSGNVSYGAAQVLIDNLLGVFLAGNGILNMGGGALNTGIGITTTVDNSVFFNNRALNGNGGAIQNGDALGILGPGFYILYDGTLNVTNSVFLKNTASANGGAISSISLVPASVSDPLPLNLTVSGSKFQNNQAASGNAIYTHNSSNTLSGNNYGPQQNIVDNP